MGKETGKLATIRPDEEWRVDSDLRTLIEAEAIKADPKRYAKAQAMAQKKMLETAKVASNTDKD